MSVQLDEYVTKLAPIYSEILAAFPEIDPSRKQGYGLAAQSLHSQLSESGQTWSLHEIQLACQQLASRGIVSIENRIFVHPTALGERLITKITGKCAPEATVPELPAPPADA